MREPGDSLIVSLGALAVGSAVSIAAWLLAFWALSLVLGLVAEPDSTDTPDGARSGMSLHVDHRTGCQYLSKPFGGITPRLDANGKHMCSRMGKR